MYVYHLYVLKFRVNVLCYVTFGTFYRATKEPFRFAWMSTVSVFVLLIAILPHTCQMSQTEFRYTSIKVYILLLIVYLLHVKDVCMSFISFR